MGSGVHFSLDQLPERYRAQVSRAMSAPNWSHVASVRPHNDGGKPQDRRDDKRGDDKRGNDKRGNDKCGNDKCGGGKHRHGKGGGKCRAPINLPRSAAEGPNKTEERFNREMLLGRGKYEALTLHLPGGVKYTPDFVFENEGKVYLAEVKGNYRLPTHGRSVMAFKIACSEFPMFGFVFAELCGDGRTWKVGVYEGGLLKHTAEGTAQELHGEETDGE